MANLFICNKATDKVKAEKLAKGLKDLGHEVWFNDWEIGLGDSIVEKIEEGLAGAAFLILCFSEKNTDESWFDQKWMSSLSRQLDGCQIKLLPVRISIGDPPLVLAGRKYADFEKDWEMGFSEVLRTLTPVSEKIPKTQDGFNKEIFLLHDIDEERVADQLFSGIKQHGYFVDSVGMTLVGSSYQDKTNAMLAMSCPVVFCATKKSAGSSFLNDYIKNMDPDRLLLVLMEKDIDRTRWVTREFEPIQFWQDPNGLVEKVMSEIDSLFKLLAEKAAIGSRTKFSDWKDVLKIADVRVNRVLGGLLGSETNPGVYTRQLYVGRKKVDQEIEDFLGSDKTALILAAPTGTGMTNLLCNWVEKLRDADHCVLMYNCSLQPNLNIEKQIAVDFNRSPSLWKDILKIINGAAGVAEKKMVIVLDEVHGFKEKDAGPREFLKHLNSIIERLPGLHIRFLLSCNIFTWNRLNSEIARHFSQSFYHTSELGGYVELGFFSEAEAKEAYQNYYSFFNLKTTWDELYGPVRNQFRLPILLRMLAVTRRGDNIPDKQFTLKVFEQYYAAKVKGDEFLLDYLAEKMLNNHQIKIELDFQLRNDEVLTAQYENTDSSFWKLQEKGIMFISSGGRFKPSNYSFANGTIAYIVLAKHLLMKHRGEIQPLENEIKNLVKQVDRFPLAWDIARTILELLEDKDLHLKLAANNSPEIRELTAESLRELFVDDAPKILSWLNFFLKTDQPEVWRTALKAAFYIGPGAESIFTQAIRGQSALLQETGKMLYLLYKQSSDTGESLSRHYILWKNNPDFVYHLLEDILEQMKVSNLGNLMALKKNFNFFMRTSVIIYINHCERKDVINKTAELFYRFAADHPILMRNLPHIINFVSYSFSMPILKTILFKDLDHVQPFFKRSVEERACLERIAPALDPDIPLNEYEKDLATMLDSDVPFFNVAAALVLCIHATTHFGEVVPFIEGCLSKLQPQGKLMTLAAFSVPLPETPSDWIPLLEKSTRNLIQKETQSFLNTDSGILSAIDLAFIPLGFAYGKRRGGRIDSMPLFVDVIKDGLDKGLTHQTKRCLKALGPVGIYYPVAVLQTLREAITDFDQEVVRKSLSGVMGLMRTFYLDLVDEFYEEIGVTADFKKRALEETDPKMLERYIEWLGYYNNLVHFSIHYPYMRKNLSMKAFNLLAKVNSEKEFLKAYSIEAVKMFQEVDYNLLEWTKRSAN